MRYLVPTLALILLSIAPACGLTDPCQEQTRVVEVQWGSITESMDRLRLSQLRDAGWDCRSDGSIRNAFGNTVGRRYVCTTCE